MEMVLFFGENIQSEHFMVIIVVVPLLGSFVNSLPNTTQHEHSAHTASQRTATQLHKHRHTNRAIPHVWFWTEPIDAKDENQTLPSLNGISSDVITGLWRPTPPPPPTTDRQAWVERSRHSSETEMKLISTRLGNIPAWDSWMWRTWFDATRTRIWSWTWTSAVGPSGLMAMLRVLIRFSFFSRSTLFWCQPPSELCFGSTSPHGFRFRFY